MNELCDVAIVGAGPYALSLAAHLRELGVSFRIFGKPLDSWRNHMPKGMLLKSDGFATNLSAPKAGATLKDYCAQHGLDYADRGTPVPLETFVSYADWFRKLFVFDLEEVNVADIVHDKFGFRLTLETGEIVGAKRLVMAPGITWFAYTPELLATLPITLGSHSFDHHDVSSFKGRDVVVIGAGASAIDTAVALHEAGAMTRIVTRRTKIPFHSGPSAVAPSLIGRLRKPSSGIGPGWRSYLCANAPWLFHAMPETLRLRATRNHLGPAPCWFTRERVEGQIEQVLGRQLTGADSAERVTLRLTNSESCEEALTCDHVVAATGFRVDLRRLLFVDCALREKISAVEHTPILSRHFESSVPGLYFIGVAAANSFGPLMRFMFGAEFVALRLAKHLKHRQQRSVAGEAA
jgi:thioredoxin reductase